MSEATFVAVALPVPVRRLFTYRAPAALRGSLAPGVRVRVPFARRESVGTVVEVDCPSPDEGIDVKPILEITDEARRLPEDVFELTRFVSDYYLCSRGSAIEAALPPDVSERVRWRLLAAPEATPPPPRATAQVQLFNRLREQTTGLAWEALQAGEKRAAQKLLESGAATKVAAVPKRTERGESPPIGVGLPPTAAQAQVLDELLPDLGASEERVFLLFGATGAGKTEVFFRAAQQTLERGRGVIYLVPEIGLTPLLIDKVTRRFPGRAVVLHSALGKRERFDAWQKLKRGDAQFVVGTRSAIFAPVAKLGLIVVDEEQDGSYKQEETPRYNARDLAVVRARQAQAAVLLGSATPSMESFHHTANDRYQRLDLGARIDDRPMPTVSWVDMRDEFRWFGETRPLSRRLLAELAACKERGEQSLVLRNRRGWSIAIHCPDCGNRVECDQCSISMTWHRREQSLRCHYCDTRRGKPTQCERCGGTELQLIGDGSEQVEALLAEALPDLRIARMDRDSVRRKGEHEALLRRFADGSIDVLVGTQMIAKGHDFPNVTLVGVLAADSALGIPDFRAAERGFQLITQVAGRAGRGEKPGQVILQAFDPENPALQMAASQDYLRFYEREIRYRRALKYPPLAGVVRIVILHKEEFQAREWAEQFAEVLRSICGKRGMVQGPGPAALARLQGRYRQQILARSAGRRRMVEAVGETLDRIQGQIPANAIQVDVDPYSLL